MPVLKVKKDGVWEEIAGVSNHTHDTSDITDFPISLPANGGNADTVDGKHADEFALASETVCFTEQTLTEDQKTQARANIGACAVDSTLTQSGQAADAKVVGDNQKVLYDSGGIGYSEVAEDVLLPEMEVDTNNDDGTAMLGDYPLIEGGTYIVTFDGEQYICTAIAYNGAVVLGDLTFSYDGEFPFIVAYVPSELNAFIGASPSTHTVSIVHKIETVHQISPKYYDRLAWSEYNLIFPETQISFTDSTETQIPDTLIGLEVGKQYIVTWNNVEYRCVGSNIDGYAGACVGNLGLAEMTDTGEPFLILDVIEENFIAIGSTEYPQDNTFMIAEEIVHKIDPKYYERLAWVDNVRAAVLPETTITTDDNGEAYAEGSIGLVAGQDYVVTWDGIEYKCTGVEVDGFAICLGNMGALEPSYGVTGEPFVLLDVSAENAYGFIAFDGAGSYTISISTQVEVVNKMDPKFLPDMTWDMIGTRQVELYNMTLGGFEETVGMTISPSPFELIEGQQYEVIWDGVSYPATCISQGSNLRIGNGYMSSAGITSEPFLIMYMSSDDAVMIVAMDVANQKMDTTTPAHSVVINEMLINKIDAQYLPEIKAEAVTISDSVQQLCTSATNVDEALVEVLGKVTNLEAADTSINTKIEELEADDASINAKITNLEAADTSINTKIEELEADIAEKHGPNYMILADAVSGYNYIVEIRNGTLIATCRTVSISVTQLPDKTAYVIDEQFDPTGMIVTATCEDGSTKVINDYSFSTDAFTLDDLTNNKNFEIVYTEGVQTFTTHVLITLATSLDDFEYTTNDDGTYTLTGWKGTLNGETSTIIAIPDDSSIII